MWDDRITLCLSLVFFTYGSTLNGGGVAVVDVDQKHMVRVQKEAEQQKREQPAYFLIFQFCVTYFCTKGCLFIN